MKARLMVLVIGLLTFQIASFGQSSNPAPPPPPSQPAEIPHEPIQEFATLGMISSARPGQPGEYLSGNVKLVRGPVPWDPIPVSVVCDGKVRYTTNTDPTGNFTIGSVKQPGSTTTKADKKPFAAQFVGCSVEAALPGFESSPLAVVKRNVKDDPNIGSITLRPEAGAVDAELSSTSAAAPKNAVKLFEKARNVGIANKPDSAQKNLQRALEIYPQFAEAWYQLGKIEQTANPTEAWNSFSKAAAADPKFALPYGHLAMLAAQAEKWQELVDVTTRALKLNPNGTIDIWYYNAIGNYHLRNWDVAGASAATSLAMDPLHVQPNTEQLLAMTLAEKQDFAGALQHLRNCLTYIHPGPNLDLVKEQIAEMEPAVGAPK
ncbi:MAG: hypothetical protein WBR10_19440 [Candidatus Acidiferrum sp.]